MSEKSASAWALEFRGAWMKTAPDQPEDAAMMDIRRGNFRGNGLQTARAVFLRDDVYGDFGRFYLFAQRLKNAILLGGEHTGMSAVVDLPELAGSPEYLLDESYMKPLGRVSAWLNISLAEQGESYFNRIVNKARAEAEAWTEAIKTGNPLRTIPYRENNRHRVPSYRVPELRIAEDRRDWMKFLQRKGIE